MGLYRYKQITDAHTTYRVNPPTTDGQIDETFFEHGTLEDGLTYFACQTPLPPQWPQCKVEVVTPPQAYKQKLREISPHYDLLDKRANAGLYMRADKHIVAGNATTVQAWKDQQAVIFGVN